MIQRLMKKILLLICCIIPFLSWTQNHDDTIRMLKQTAALYDLDYSTAEADSMIGNIVSWKRIYVRMHEQLPRNDMPFPFAFNPAPFGYKIPVTQQKVEWTIPLNVSLPKNKTDLAYYSLIPVSYTHLRA